MEESLKYSDSEMRAVWRRHFRSTTTTTSVSSGNVSAASSTTTSADSGSGVELTAVLQLQLYTHSLRAKEGLDSSTGSAAVVYSAVPVERLIMEMQQIIVPVVCKISMTE